MSKRTSVYLSTFLDPSIVSGRKKGVTAQTHSGGFVKALDGWNKRQADGDRSSTCTCIRIAISIESDWRTVDTIEIATYIYYTFSIVLYLVKKTKGFRTRLSSGKSLKPTLLHSPPVMVVEPSTALMCLLPKHESMENVQYRLYPCLERFSSQNFRFTL
jgi:hypothetical protein